jgi:NADH:ubiquinone oxidoreductase subunit C
MAQTFSDIINVVKAVASDITPVEHHGDLTITVPKSQLLDVLHELKDNPQMSFSQLIDVTAIESQKLSLI